MSSKKAEDVHTELIKKLLTDSGVVCERSPQLSEESEEEEQEEEEGLEEEYEPAPEQPFEVEDYHVPEELEAEEYSNTFPTPSLRRLIPERIRRIEAQNRIRVLPDQFPTDIDPAEIPRINYTAPQVYIDKLADITGCTKLYKNSLPVYWFLDTLANLLRRAQEDDLDKPTQAVLIQWFCEWMKEMQHFDAANRERMMRRWRDNMLAAAKVIAEDDIFPTPDDAGVYYKVREPKEPTETISKVNVDTAKSKPIVKPDIVAPLEVGEPRPFVYECALKDLTKIIHYIYDLFATDYQYDLVRSIFTFGPEYHLIHGPFQIELPKRILGVLKPKKEPKAKSPKGKQEKASKGPKKKEPDTEEYLALMQLINISNKEELEKEEKDRELWNRRNSILPLNLAATPEFFENYWPTPAVISPPPTPKPITPETKSKKGKGK